MNKILKVGLAVALALVCVMGAVACDGGCAHDWVEVNSVESTCTVEGKKEYECSKCGETKTDNLGFGEHTGKWAYDGEKHWKENTCEHEVAVEKQDHVLTDGACACGYYSVEKVLEHYNGLEILKDGVNVSMNITVMDKKLKKHTTEADFKDNVIKMDYGRNSLHFTIRDGEKDYVYDYVKWTSHNTSIFGSNFAQYLNAIFGTDKGLIDSVEGYKFLSEGKWQKIVEGDIVVLEKDGEGRVLKVEVRDVMQEEPYLSYTIEYGNADVGDVPVIPDSER